MELYLDTADVAAVRAGRGSCRWPVSPPTRPSPRPAACAAELLPALREVLGTKGRLFAQVMGKTETEMVRRGVCLEGSWIGTW